MLKCSEIGSSIQKENMNEISFCLYVTDNQFDGKLPMLIGLQDLRDLSNQKQTSHKQKHTLIVIKQEGKRKPNLDRRIFLEKRPQRSK